MIWGMMPSVHINRYQRYPDDVSSRIRETVSYRVEDFVVTSTRRLQYKSGVVNSCEEHTPRRGFRYYTWSVVQRSPLKPLTQPRTTVENVVHWWHGTTEMIG